MFRRSKIRPKKKMSKRKKIISIASVVLILGIIAGGFYYQHFILGKPLPTVIQPEPEPEPTLQIVDLDSTSRPFGVMINNIGGARPFQSGLQEAFIIYEIIVEGGISRYLALFIDAETERIGSVRSARHYFLDYALEHDAIYIYHGSSPQAKNDLRSFRLDTIVVNSSTTGWRDNTIRANSEHRLFTKIEMLEKGMGNRRAERNNDFLLNYSIPPINLKEMENAQVANNVSIRYSSGLINTYEYDTEKEIYKRSVNNAPHVDFVTKEQYTFKNIITYQVRNTHIGRGRQTIHNTGTGTGYFITNGYAVPITWEKKTRSSQTIYRFENGEEINVNDGNTFIQIQPTGQQLIISE